MIGARITVCVALVLTGCSRSEPPTSVSSPASTPTKPTKDPETARKMIAAGAVVIDVRSAEEYAGGHLPNAVNIPVQEVSARLDEIAKLVANDQARPIVVYCAAGARAAKAKAQLDAAGYSHVVNGGGFDGLADGRTP